MCFYFKLMKEKISEDNVPATVDAIVYFYVQQPTLAVLKVQDYKMATHFGAQSILRDMIGKFTLDQLF